LEYIRQRFNSDQIHFASTNRKITFKLPQDVGPFIVRSREAQNVVQRMLDALDLNHGKPWKYDPHQIISKRRIQLGLGPYLHQPNPELEKLANMDSWGQVSDLMKGGPQQQIKVDRIKTQIVSGPQVHVDVSSENVGTFQEVTVEQVVQQCTVETPQKVENRNKRVEHETTSEMDVEELQSHEPERKKSRIEEAIVQDVNSDEIVSLEKTSEEPMVKRFSL
jgi:hypothetical protein